MGLAQCHASDCNASQILKSRPPSFCAGVSCTQAECCDALHQCQVSDCRGAYVLKANLPSSCGGVNCTQTECCDALDQCQAAQCSPPYVMKSSLPSFCAGVSCTQAECCDALDQCQAEDCSSLRWVSDFESAGIPRVFPTSPASQIISRAQALKLRVETIPTGATRGDLEILLAWRANLSIPNASFDVQTFVDSVDPGFLRIPEHILPVGTSTFTCGTMSRNPGSHAGLAEVFHLVFSVDVIAPPVLLDILAPESGSAACGFTVSAVAREPGVPLTGLSTPRTTSDEFLFTWSCDTA